MDSQLEIKTLIETYSDLDHQLRGPITFAIARLNHIQVSELDDKLRFDILAALGLCRKALQVVRSIRLFSALSLGTKIRLNQTPITSHDILEILLEVASDTELLLKASSGIRIVVNRESFRTTPSRLMLDKDLIEQAIRNLVDNSAKYSYANTIVNIYGEIAAEGFSICVANQGLPIHPQDLAKLATKRWRSEEALSVTAEGSGIGLWIVREIMGAHGGELIIVPTDGKGVTTVKILFKAAR